MRHHTIALVILTTAAASAGVMPIANAEPAVPVASGYYAGHAFRPPPDPPDPSSSAAAASGGINIVAEREDIANKVLALRYMGVI
jgi:hypothetical protein